MGEVFAGRYELIDMIGEGGMGAVWRVRDRKRDRIVAAKVLRQSDAGSLLRFMREQGVRIHHPHVVTPLGWAGEDDQVLFTMPIVEGGSVADLLRGGRMLPARYAAEVLRQTLDALDAVHSAGVVHRDIKPANLLLDATGAGRPHVWLTDFGVALPVDAPRLTEVSMVMGTPGYLAPEQLRGAEPNPVSDLYAAGMVGIQLATGHRPRSEMRTQRTDLPTRPPQVPDALWQLLTDLADPDPANRPPTARAALMALAHPDLAWVDQREVAVPRLMPPLSGVAEGEFLRPGDSSQANSTRDVEMPAATRPAQNLQQPEQTAHAARSQTAHRPAASPKRGGVPRVAVAALVGVLAVGATGAAWWPRSADPAGPQIAQVGGVCGWWDAGGTADNGDGDWLRCQGSGDRYTWAK